MVCLVVGIDYGLLKSLNWILTEWMSYLKGMFPHLLAAKKEFCESDCFALFTLVFYV